MTDLLEELKKKVAEVRKTVSKEALSAPDVVKGNYITTPGIYEVHSLGFAQKTSQKGSTYNVISIEELGGKSAEVMVFLHDKDKKPDPIKMQKLLKGFGFVWSQAQIASVWDALYAVLPVLTVGKVHVSLSYYGYNIDYLEKGTYCIRDYSSKDRKYPDNLVIDPVNQDVITGGSREELETFMVSKGMKMGGKNWTFLRPTDDFVPTEEQIKAAEIMNSLMSDEPLPVAAPKAGPKFKPFSAKAAKEASDEDIPF